jgi:hypothetical protein
MMLLNLPFEAPLPLLVEFDEIASIDCRLIRLCLTLVGAE